MTSTKAFGLSFSSRHVTGVSNSDLLVAVPIDLQGVVVLLEYLRISGPE